MEALQILAALAAGVAGLFAVPGAVFGLLFAAAERVLAHRSGRVARDWRWAAGAGVGTVASVYIALVLAGGLLMAFDVTAPPGPAWWRGAATFGLLVAPPHAVGAGVAWGFLHRADERPAATLLAAAGVATAGPGALIAAWAALPVAV